MRWIVESSLKFRLLIVGVAAGLIVFGVTQLRDMPVDVFPEFEPPRVEIQTEALGLSAGEVESLIAVPLEELLSGTAELETIRSESVPGLSSIELIFEPGTDPIHARQLVQERLSSVYTLPNVSKPPVMLQPLSATSRVMMIGLSSNELSLIEMSVLARWTVTPKLLGVPGVANVAVWGQRDRQLQVYVDPDRLRAHGVSQDQVISTTGDALWFSPLSFLNASVPGTGGWIDSPNQRLGIRHTLPISSADDLAQVPVDGTALRLGDVGDVVEGHPPVIGDALINGGPGLLVIVEKFPGTDTLAVTKGVEAALEELRPGLPGVEIDSSIYRTETFIQMAIDNLAMAMLVGALLGVLILVLFFEWRAALISIIAIPLSLVAAGVVLYLLGATLNIIVLAGFVVALGAVVDDAISSIDNIVRRLHQYRSERTDKSVATIILEASLEMRGATVYGTLIVVLVVMPVFLLGGLTGAFLEPMVISYTLALLASVLVALTITPALSLILLSNAPLERRRESGAVRLLQRFYGGVLPRIMDRPRPALVAAAVIVFAGLAASGWVAQSLYDRAVTVPSFEERDLLIEMDSAPGTSHPEMVRIVTRVSQELQSIPGVDKVGAHIGRAVTGDQIVGANSSQLWVSVDPKVNYSSTVAAIQTTIDGYAGLAASVQPYLKERTKGVLREAGEAIVVRIYGPELEVLSAKAEEVRQALSGVDNLVDLRVDGQDTEPHVEVEVDLAKAQSLGLSPGDVRRAAAAKFAGLQVGNLFEQQKVFEVVVWSTPETRHSLSSLQDLLIDTPNGGHVRLGEVADVRVVSIPVVIKHEAISAYIDVLANVRGRDNGSVTRDVERVLQDVEFPLEYHPELLGEYAESQAAQWRMLGFVVAAAIGILLLLQASLGSWRLASLVFLTLPVAIVGGVLAAVAGDDPTTLGSLLGLLAVFGIGARNGILLVNHYQHLEQHEGVTLGPELVLRGTQERLAPILITALTIALAVVPLVVLGNIAGLEIVHPMAVVILGGLVTSTLLNLFVIPVLYLRFAPRHEIDASRIRWDQVEPNEGGS